MYDCIIIGAGISGCAVARELTRYTSNVCVLEKQSDVCEGTTKANSAIVHAGFDAAPHSAKAFYNVWGNRLYGSLTDDLEVPFIQNGSLVLCFSEQQRPHLMELMDKGVQNGVPHLRIVEKDALKVMEPHISENAVCALLAPTGGIVCPFTLCIALAENAAQNGASFFFEQEVDQIQRTQQGFAVFANGSVYEGKVVVNASGVYADEISQKAHGMAFSISPRKGEYCVLDKTAGKYVSHTLFQLPGPKGKGVLVTPTVHGNLMIGPNAQDIGDKTDTATTMCGVAEILDVAALSVDKLPNSIIASFAGLRARPKSDDFYIGEDTSVDGLFHAAGIESPGLSAAPAIGVDLSEKIAAKLDIKPREDFIKTRKAIQRFADMDDEQRQKALEHNPAYGNIVCRCETVTEAEVIEAIHRVPGARSVDGVKRRTRCGTGRCQAGFCLPKVSQILSRELQVPIRQITKKGGGSVILTGDIKEEPCE